MGRRYLQDMRCYDDEITYLVYEVTGEKDSRANNNPRVDFRRGYQKAALDRVPWLSYVGQAAHRRDIEALKTNNQATYEVFKTRKFIKR